MAGTSPAMTAMRGLRANLQNPYFPCRSTLSFSFWFISWTFGSVLVCPVVCVVEAGGALGLGSELCSGAAGRVAVVGGVVLLWA